VFKVDVVVDVDPAKSPEVVAVTDVTLSLRILIETVLVPLYSTSVGPNTLVAFKSLTIALYMFSAVPFTVALPSKVPVEAPTASDIKDIDLSLLVAM
jgi:hypothetical protein